ncbi:hypothetical protein [Oryza sativa Japonica Group]|uniref:Uncharacterized protein n=1 Tax=Oryza sativa subsp. japonica TaxID=39947 RepID=Q5QNK3_ORYSJ|nr:hypothetical protein [Oryza sativa Japonica Group]
MGAVDDGSESSDGRVGNGEHEVHSSLGNSGGPRNIGVGECEEATALSVPDAEIVMVQSLCARGGNGEFPVGGYITRPAPAEENFPRPRPREMQLGSIFHHHRLRVAFTCIHHPSRVKQISLNVTHRKFGTNKGRAEEKVDSRC